jgi:hypothetical protein
MLVIAESAAILQRLGNSLITNSIQMRPNLDSQTKPILYLLLTNFTRHGRSVLYVKPREQVAR